MDNSIIASLYCLPESELKKLYSRSEIDLVWLDKMQSETKGTAHNHYKDQYFKELQYQEVLQDLLDSR